MELIPDVAPLAGKDGYYTKLLYPQKLGFKDMMEISEPVTMSFLEVGIFQHLFGPAFVPVGYSTVRQTITDPRERVNRLIKEAYKFKLCVNANARYLHLEFMEPNSLAWGLYETDTNKCVGMALWGVPDSMVEEKNKRLRMDTIWFNMYKHWTEFKYKVVEFFAHFWFPYHPLHNDRILEVREDRFPKFPDFVDSTQERHDQLMEMQPEQLATELYTFQDMLFFSEFALDPYYQSKGLGTKFFNQMLGQIPNRPEFNGGPQKVMVIGVQKAIPFYERLGFTMTFDHRYTSKDGVYIVNSRMDMTR